MSRDSESKVYVGDLPRDATPEEIERAFEYYGKVNNVWVARNPPGFAFVTFDDKRDAEDAVRGLDGDKVCGTTVRVEMSSGRSKSRSFGGGRGGYGGGGGGGSFGGRGGGGGGSECYNCGERGHFSRECPRRGGGSNGRRRLVPGCNTPAT